MSEGTAGHAARLAELQAYRPRIARPADLEAFWSSTLAEARSHPIAVEARPVESGLRLIETWDVAFSGYGGQRIRAWQHRPAATRDALPIVVEYLGYNGARGLPHERTAYALAGYAHLVVDNRGSGAGWAVSDTPDDDPDAGLDTGGGRITRGILAPETYFYRRAHTDAVRALDAVAELPGVEPARVAVTGISNGGGLAIAAAALGTPVTTVMADVPFLAHVVRTLSYVDVANLAPLATAPALFSVGLLDEICPPEAVFAAFHAWGGDDKRIEVYPYNGHEGGEEFQHVARLRWLAERLPI
jgi:cephalosporin-C deacetylase